MHSLIDLCRSCRPHIAKPFTSERRARVRKKRSRTRTLALTSPWSRHSGCGKNSCTETGSRSPGRKVHPRPRRAPRPGRGTFFGPLLRSAPNMHLHNFFATNFWPLSHLREYHPHGFSPPLLRCPIVIRLPMSPQIKRIDKD